MKPSCCVGERLTLALLIVSSSSKAHTVEEDVDILSPILLANRLFRMPTPTNPPMPKFGGAPEDIEEASLSLSATSSSSESLPMTISSSLITITCLFFFSFTFLSIFLPRSLSSLPRGCTLSSRVGLLGSALLEKENGPARCILGLSSRFKGEGGTREGEGSAERRLGRSAGSGSTGE